MADHRKKYMRYLHEARREARALEARHASLVQLMTEYFRGDLNGSDTLKELGWEPFRGLVIKEDLSRKVATDKKVVKLAEAVGEAKEKISVLAGIIESIKSYSFDIRGAMEWEKFLAGA